MSRQGLALRFQGFSHCPPGSALPSSGSCPQPSSPLDGLLSCKSSRDFSLSVPPKCQSPLSIPKQALWLGACTSQPGSWLLLAPKVDRALTSVAHGKQEAVARSSRSDRCLLLAGMPSDHAAVLTSPLISAQPQDRGKYPPQCPP